MKRGVLQLTLRQVQADLSNPIVWIVLAGVGVVLAFAGAFGTQDVLRPFPRLLYWVGIVCLTYCLGSFLSQFFQNLWQNWNKWVRIGVSGLIIGIVFVLLIVALNTAIFGPIFDQAFDLAEFAVIVIAVTSVVNLILNIVFEAVGQSQSQTEAATPDGPAILDRIPYDLRSPLVSLSVEDHYVRVRTTKGEEMILMRLSDAIKETTPVDGFHVHRSYWVARAAIQSVCRSGSGALITVSHGPDIPVSRSKIPLLKNAGLL